MAKKCPPGVFCIENMTLFFILLIIILILVIGYFSLSNIISSSRKLSTDNKYTLNVTDTNNNQSKTGLYPRPGYSFSNIENDVLLNPYEAPLRDNRPFQNNNNNNNNNLQNGMPINVSTQSYDTNYRQIGILTRVGGNKETILPLMGRPLITNRDKWNFYAMSENNNLLKLPISNNGRKCMGQNGCDDVYSGDTVQVDGYNDTFKVTTYENDTPRYIPYL